MATSDIRWIQRLENFHCASAFLQRGIGLSQTRALSELEQLGLIHSFKFTHELSWLLIRDFLVDQGVAGISGSHAMERHHSGSDVDLCLVAPSLQLEDLLLLGTRLDDQMRRLTA